MDDEQSARELAQEAIRVANDASHRAHAASNHALDAHAQIGHAARELSSLKGSVDGLKLAMADAFRELGVKLKAEIEETTAVRNLRRENRTLKNRWKWLAGVLTAVLTAVIIAEVVHLLIKS